MLFISLIINSLIIVKKMYNAVNNNCNVLSILINVNDMLIVPNKKHMKTEKKWPGNGVM